MLTLLSIDTSFENIYWNILDCFGVFGTYFGFIKLDHVRTDFRRSLVIILDVFRVIWYWYLIYKLMSTNLGLIVDLCLDCGSDLIFAIFC